MAKPTVIAVRRLGEVAHGYGFVVTVTDGEVQEDFRVWVGGSTSIEAGFGPDGPSTEWVDRRFTKYPWRLDHYEPLLPQLKEQAAALSDDDGYELIPSEPGDG